MNHYIGGVVEEHGAPILKYHSLDTDGCPLWTIDDMIRSTYIRLYDQLGGEHGLSVTATATATPVPSTQAPAQTPPTVPEPVVMAEIETIDVPDLTDL